MGKKAFNPLEKLTVDTKHWTNIDINFPVALQGKEMCRKCSNQISFT